MQRASRQRIALVVIFCLVQSGLAPCGASLDDADAGTARRPAGRVGVRQPGPATSLASPARACRPASAASPPSRAPGDGGRAAAALRHAGQCDRRGELPAGQHRVGRSPAPAPPAFRASPPTSASTAARPVALQDRHARDRLSARHLPDGLLRRRGRAQGRDDPAVRVAAADAAGLPDRRGDRPRRLRQLGGVGVVDGAARPPRRASTSRSSCAMTPAGPSRRATSSSSCATTRASPICCSRRPTRRGRRTTGTAATACTSGSPAGPRLQGQLQPSVHDARSRLPKTFVFNAEYPMVRWLEANGYDVSYIDRRRHATGAAPSSSSTRSSCRSATTNTGPATQRANVEAARDAGVNLAFFSGNEVFWKTRWENSIDGSSTPYRTLVCYKETHADAKIDPDADVDRHVARPALQPAGRRRPSGERADRHDLHGQRLHGVDARSKCRRPKGGCASGANTARRDARSPADTATLPLGTLGLRVGRGPGQRRRGRPA